MNRKETWDGSKAARLLCCLSQPGRWQTAILPTWSKALTTLVRSVHPFSRRSMIVAVFVSDGLQERKSHRAEWHIAVMCVLEIVHISRLQNVPLTFFGSSLSKNSSAKRMQTANFKPRLVEIC